MDVTVELHCGRCGSANYSLPGGIEEAATLLCNDCGEEMGRVGDLFDELLVQVQEHSMEALRRDIDRLAAPEPTETKPA